MKAQNPMGLAQNLTTAPQDQGKRAPNCEQKAKKIDGVR
jgi:hypothetical protein